MPLAVNEALISYIHTNRLQFTDIIILPLSILFFT